MEIWLVRHGETEWSRSGRHTGVTDLVLTPEGERQAAALGERIGDHPFGSVLSSPLRRALDTARLAGFGGRVETSHRLVEYRYGEDEGRTTKDIQAERPGWELFRDGCPGGERPEEVGARMDAFLQEIDEPGGDVLLFGHGHSLRALAVRYLGLPIEVAGLLRLHAGTVSILGHEHDHRALVLWNQSVVGPP